MTIQNAQAQKKALQYHTFFVGTKPEGFKVPCVVLDSTNVLRTYLLAITPENVTREQVVALIQGGDHKALKAADVVLKARIQRWFKGKEANEHDADGYIPSVGQNGNVVDIPLHTLDGVGAMMQALVTSDLTKKAATLQEAIRKEVEEGKRKCTACGHTARAGQKFCQECGTKLPEEAPKETSTDGKWTCTCGHKDNGGKFCMECGAKRPETSGVGGTIAPKEEAPKQETAPKGKGKSKPATEGAPPLEQLQALLANLSPEDAKSLGAKLLRK
jgi:hypothetical protein